MGKIYWFTGQPGAGKTTLAKVIYHSILDHSSEAIHVDGDDIRIMFNNTDYTNYGRERNVERAHDIAYFMSKKGFDVVVSMVSPFRNQRNRFKENPNFIEIYVHTKDKRGREHFHVVDYEKPLENFVDVDTTNKTENESITDLIYKLENYKERREKKLTYLTNKLSFARFRVFDKTLFLYNDVEQFKNENNISILNTNYDSENGGHFKYYYDNVKNLYHTKEFYENLNLPWEKDEFPKEWEKDKICQSVYDFNNTSVFTLALETENDYDLKINNTPFESSHFFEKLNLSRLQISEKSIIPLLSGSMPFYIVDNL